MQHLIKKYKLIPHPEGGYFREIYRSKQKVLSSVVADKRDSVTHIFFLLAKGQISRFHKVMHDEIWNFYEGSPIRLIKFDGDKVEEDIIGANSNSYVSVVTGGLYQAAESTGEYSLVGCTVAPGFDFADFSFLGDDSESLKIFNMNHPQYQRFV